MMESNLKKIDIYNWITLLYTWNQTLEPDMEQLSGLKLSRGMTGLYIVTLLI